MGTRPQSQFLSLVGVVLAGMAAWMLLGRSMLRLPDESPPTTRASDEAVTGGETIEAKGAAVSRAARDGRAGADAARTVPPMRRAESDGTQLVLSIVDPVGVPIPDMKVRLTRLTASDPSGTRTDAWREGPWSGVTDAGGAVRFIGLAPATEVAPERMSVGGEWIAIAQPITVGDLPLQRERIVVELCAEIHGELVDQELTPIAGIPVILTRSPSTGLRYLSVHDEVVQLQHSDDRGRFRFVGVPLGDWRVGPVGADTEPLEQRVAQVGYPVRLRLESQIASVVVQTSRGLFVAGRVVTNADGISLANVDVVATSTAGTGSVESRCDPEGRFAIGPLLPGQHWVETRIRGNRNLIDADPVIANAGELDLTLVVQVGCRLRVSVSPADRAAPCPASLSLRESSSTAGESPVERGVSGGDGTYLLQGLAPGRYDLMAISSTEGAALMTGIPVFAGSDAETLRVQLRPSAELQIANDSGSPTRIVIRCSDMLVGAYPLDIAERVSVPVPSSGRIEIDTEPDIVASPRSLVVYAGSPGAVTLRNYGK